MGTKDDMGFIAGILGVFGGMFGLWLFIISIPALILSFWTDRNLDFWLTQVKGEEVDVPWILSFLASIPYPFTFFANIVGEICRFAGLGVA